MTFAPAEADRGGAVFHYLDTASSRAEIRVASAKLAIERLAIVGIGGTGSYVLDLIAKTPVREIHLYDGDVFLNHNGFRAPGASRRGLTPAPEGRLLHHRLRPVPAKCRAHPYRLNGENAAAR